MAGDSVIGQGTVVRGNVRGSGALEIYGCVEGDVTIDGDVTLGEAAAVRGNVSGAQVTIGGAVQGDLRGSQAVLVESGARVVGDVLAPRIGIADGALVRGNVRTEGEPALVPPARRPVAAARPVSAFGAPRPVAVLPARSPEPRPAPVAEARAKAEHDSTPAKSSPEHEPPPPVVPALPKNARGKKKSRPK